MKNFNFWEILAIFFFSPWTEVKMRPRTHRPHVRAAPALATKNHDKSQDWDFWNWHLTQGLEKSLEKSRKKTPENPSWDRGAAFFTARKINIYAADKRARFFCWLEEIKFQLKFFRFRVVLSVSGSFSSAVQTWFQSIENRVLQALLRHSKGPCSWSPNRIQIWVVFLHIYEEAL